MLIDQNVFSNFFCLFIVLSQKFSFFGYLIPSIQDLWSFIRPSFTLTENHVNKLKTSYLKIQHGRTQEKPYRKDHNSKKNYKNLKVKMSEMTNNNKTFQKLLHLQKLSDSVVKFYNHVATTCTDIISCFILSILLSSWEFRNVFLNLLFT